MKASELYAALKDEIGPWCKANGFKRGSATLSWTRPEAGKHLTFWCQNTGMPWDDYAGGKFVVEFQFSKTPRVGTGSLAERGRLHKLIDAAGREEIRRIQNSVIASLTKPPRDHLLLRMTRPETQRWFLREFEPVSEPYDEKLDLWFRYRTAEQIREWGRFVVRQLPTCLRTIATRPVEPA
jgi:hypothetical protein